MKNLLLLVCFSVLLFGCPAKVKPISERIAKTWTAQTVKENSTTVYTKGASNNVAPGYSNYSLSLAAGGAATLRDRDGNSFTGNWEVSTDGKTLTLKNLTPQPTQTNGTMTFTITSFTDTQMVLTANFAYAKTGGTTNTYTLVAG